MGAGKFAGCLTGMLLQKVSAQAVTGESQLLTDERISNPPIVMIAEHQRKTIAVTGASSWDGNRMPKPVLDVTGNMT